MGGVGHGFHFLSPHPHSALALPKHQQKRDFLFRDTPKGGVGEFGREERAPGPGWTSGNRFGLQLELERLERQAFGDVSEETLKQGRKQDEITFCQRSPRA